MSQITIHFKHKDSQEKFLEFLESPITEFEDCFAIDNRLLTITADDLDLDKLQDTAIMELTICALEQGIDYDIFI